MTAFREFKPRPIQFVELWPFQDWKIKIYRICETEGLWNDKYLDIAKGIAVKVIHERADKDENHKTGFLTIHIASMFNQIIFDWWARENELRHLVFKSNAENPTSFQNITSSGEAFCVWELAVIAHERVSWIKNVLENHQEPRFEEYYRDTIQGVI